MATDLVLFARKLEFWSRHFRKILSSLRGNAVPSFVTSNWRSLSTWGPKMYTPPSTSSSLFSIGDICLRHQPQKIALDWGQKCPAHLKRSCPSDWNSSAQQCQLAISMTNMAVSILSAYEIISLQLSWLPRKPNHLNNSKSTWHRVHSCCIITSMQSSIDSFAGVGDVAYSSSDRSLAWIPDAWRLECSNIVQHIL